MTDWTIMIKDAKGSKDGWYWAEIWKDQTIDNHNPPYSVPNSGFGLYCVRCHTSAEKEFTFVSLTNIKGFPGQPLSYFVDFSWAPTPTPTPEVALVGKPPPTAGPTPTEIHLGGKPMSHHEVMALLAPAKERAKPHATATPNPAFVKFFNSIPPQPLGDVKKIPAETYDHVVASSQGPQHFLTSDSCMGCHSAIYSSNHSVRLPFRTRLISRITTIGPGTPSRGRIRCRSSKSSCSTLTAISRPVLSGAMHR